MLVGSSAEPFIVHEGLLLGTSDFFAAALGRNRKEAEEKLVRLEDVHPYFFAMYFDWLYNEDNMPFELEQESAVGDGPRNLQACRLV